MDVLAEAVAIVDGYTDVMWDEALEAILDGFPVDPAERALFVPLVKADARTLTVDGLQEIRDRSYPYYADGGWHEPQNAMPAACYFVADFELRRRNREWPWPDEETRRHL